MTRQNFKAESFSSQAVGTYDSHEASPPLRLLLVLAVAGPFGLDCVSESVPVCWLTYYVCFSSVVWMLCLTSSILDDTL